MTGRHARDEEESLTEKITGPFRRVRQEADTEPSDTVNPNETKRRAWPVALILGTVVAAAVGIPVGLMSADPDDSPGHRPTAVTGSLSASAVPTVTKTVRETIKAGKAVPVPTVTEYRNRNIPGPTVYRTDQPAPAPTVTETIKVPVPGPTKTKVVTRPGPTKTITVEVERCFGVWRGGAREEIECP